MSKVLGVIVIARNGDRMGYYQDPNTYAAAFTESTALGAVQSHQLGTLLRSIYFTPSSPSYISGINPDLVDNTEVKVKVKAGGEGTVVFDSAIALLQGLFPPNPANKIVLANETEVVAPLGGYQYVPVETVEPANDRSLESWTDCPAFAQHIAKFYSSDEFKKVASDAQPFFANARDFIFGRPPTLENIWNINDFINSQLIHNKTYAHRLPPTLAEQARGLANFHENGVFSSKDPGGVGNIAGRTILHTILSSLERISFNGDPLQFMLIETTYQPFISLFHEVGITKDHPELGAIPDYASALAIELRRGAPPDVRDFLRFRFKNGTQGFNTINVFSHRSDIPLTEFIYRAQGSAISSNAEWRAACGAGFSALDAVNDVTKRQNIIGTAMLMFLLLGFVFLAKFVRGKRANARRIRLEGGEEGYNAITSVQPVMGEKVRYI